MFPDLCAGSASPGDEGIAELQGATQPQRSSKEGITSNEICQPVSPTLKIASPRTFQVHAQRKLKPSDLSGHSRRFYPVSQPQMIIMLPSSMFTVLCTKWPQTSGAPSQIKAGISSLTRENLTNHVTLAQAPAQAGR